MPDLAKRRFRVSDAMILIAFTAAGLALTRAYSPGMYILPYVPSEDLAGPGVTLTPKFWTQWAATTALHRFYYFTPLVGTWTLAVLALRFRRPRPGLTRLMRQPGTVAGVAAATGLAPAAALLAFEATSVNLINPLHPMLAFALGTAVGASWITLVVGRRWRSEGSWIDRTGRFLGSLWISVVPLHLLRLLSLCLIEMRTTWPGSGADQARPVGRTPSRANCDP